MASAPALLFSTLVGLLSSVRAPARAAASAASWHSVRATSSRPRSMARATNANSPTAHRAVSGSVLPGRGCGWRIM
ncbi:MAG: hypothetical protein U0871_17800 [Gemmataceae bacterium]